jgi:tRNA1(Val) A37 N6-methylase TrmN6
MQKHVKPGDVVIDATCGRGQDTLFLARLVGLGGKVWAFDRQTEAIAATRRLLDDNDCGERVQLVQDDHARMNKYITEPVQACMFNLGYLPGGDHRIITRAETTIAAISCALDILVDGGFLTIVAYPGHAGGQSEFRAVSEFLQGLSQNYCEIMEISFINQANFPPHLFLIQKLQGRSK